MQIMVYNITIITRLYFHTGAGESPALMSWMVTECCNIYIYRYMRTATVLCSIYRLSTYYMYNNMTII